MHYLAAGMLGPRGAASWRSAGPTLLNTRPCSSANVGLDSEFVCPMYMFFFALGT